MDFTSLLDYSLQCELKILDTLYQNSGWITLSDLEFQTNYNKKTINKHLKLLSEKEALLETGKLLIKKGAGVKLCLTEFEYKLLLNSVLKSCVPFTLIKLLTEHGSVSLNKIKAETFLSESSIQRQMTKLKKHLHKYGLTLIYSKGQYLFSGEEHTLRYYLYSIYWSVYRGITWPFSSQLFDKISSDVEVMTQSLSKSLATSTCSQLSLILAINFFRYKSGNPVVLKTEWALLKKINTTYFAPFKMVRALLVRSYRLSVTEAHFFVFYLLTNADFYSQNMGILIMKGHEELATEIASSVTAVYHHLEPLVRASCSKRKKARIKETLFSVHYHATLFPQFSCDITNYHLNLYIKDNIPSLYQKGQKIYEQAKKEAASPIFDAKNYLVTHYSIICAYLTYETYFEEPFVLFLDTDFPALVNELIKESLKNHIKRYFNIVFADSFSDPIDILLTVPLKDRSTYNELTIPKVFISPQIKHSELKQIYLKISELNELRKQEYKS